MPGRHRKLHDGQAWKGGVRHKLQCSRDLTKKHAKCSEDLVGVCAPDVLGVGPGRFGGVPVPRVLICNGQDDAKHDDGSKHHGSIHNVRHLHQSPVINIAASFRACATTISGATTVMGAMTVTQAVSLCSTQWLIHVPCDGLGPGTSKLH